LAIATSSNKEPSAQTSIQPSSTGSIQQRKISNLELLQALEKLKKADLIWINFDTLVRNRSRFGCQLSPAFVQLFELTPIEEAALNQALDDASRQQYALELAHSTSHSEDNGQKIVLDIPPFPQDGGKIYDQLHQTFETILGADRQALFDDFADQQVENSLDNFGAEERTITILRKTSANGSVTYFAQESQTRADGSGTGNSTFGDKAGLVQVFPVAAPFLPAGY
jgi:hypothetical protein